ncbi:anthocyanin regulatory R-S protein-like [Zea mays]|uniref:Regulatory protein n=2 Tax=Zea mays TaxID=4577 RepID=Q8S470_MAIZE|eukprot:XP_008669036.1 colored plant 1 [Zea mays]
MALSACPAQEELLQPAGRPLRKQLAAAARSINWSYSLFWSISSTQRPRVLTWTDGFYNGEVKTRKISHSVELTADQLLMQRSEQLRELYEALQSGECDRRAARPVGSLSPEDLGDTEWYYVICMTYAFLPGQGLPGRSSASNEHVWLCNAHLAGSKDFPRALLAKVPEDPDLINRATAAFREPQCPIYSEQPSSNPSADETGEAADIAVFEGLDHNAMDMETAGIAVFEGLDHNAMDMETVTAAAGRHGTGQELGEADSPSNASLEHITKGIDEFYNLCEEMDVQPLEDAWIMDGSNFEVPSSALPVDGSSAPADGSRATSFVAWTRSSQSCSGEAAAVPVIEEPQKLLKKAVAGGGAWANTNCGGGGTTVTAQENGAKNHVMLERKRREKLNEMFLVLKSLVPSIHKVDKASILAETIAYLKELQRRVQELESRRQGGSGCVSKKVCVGSNSKRKSPEFAGGAKEHPWVLPMDGTSNVTVTVSDRDVLLEVQCLWEKLLMTRVFDAIKSLHLDALSVQASALDGFMRLKIGAQFAGSGAVVPGMISQSLRKAIGKR